MKILYKWIKFRFILAFVFTMLFSVAAPASSSQSQAESIIAQHNVQALRIYNELKSKYIAKTDPLIIAWLDKLTFYHSHTFQDYPILPKKYQVLKGISHVTLAMFALFNPINQFPKNLADVKQYSGVIRNAKKEIDELPLSVEQKKRQKEILTGTQEFLQQAIDKKMVSQQALENFFYSISPLIMKNIDEATTSEIELINRQMTKIQHQLTPEEQRKLFVIIPVIKMPRQDNILGQYFSKYLNVPIESKHLIYAEGLTDPKSVLKLVGTWQIESELSATFFHDPDRMKKDLVSPNAQRYLQHCQRDNTGREALICQ